MGNKTPNSKAIVTLAIGSDYLAQWNQLCRMGWESYARKHGYDVICIDKSLDTSARAVSRSPAWQKCLILSQDFSAKYERIVWIDADILINWIEAPDICFNLPPNKVGAVEAWSSPTRDLRAVSRKRILQARGEQDKQALYEPGPRDYYALWGLPAEFDLIVQSGVLALSPLHHREILEKTYYSYEDKGNARWHYEMRPLSYELLKADCVQWIDCRFNVDWLEYKMLFYPFLFKKRNKLSLRIKETLLKVEYLHAKRCATSAFLNSYFLHFAGSRNEMTLVDSDCRFMDLIEG